MPQRLLLFAVAAAVVFAACSGSPASVTTSTVTSEPSSSTSMPADTAPPSTTLDTTTTSQAQQAGPTVATITSESPNPELVDTINELIVITEEVRGLRFLRSPLVAIVTDQELSDRVAALVEEELEPEETARDDALYEALGIIEADVDLGDLFVNLYSEQVAGFYDGDTEELVVPASDGNLTALQKLTMVHELTHSLTDQHFEFNEVSNDLYDQDRFEEASALSALLEGDATWTELIYFQTAMSVDDQRAVIDESSDIDTSTLEMTPSFIADSLIWPYDLSGGTGFVSTLWTENGDFSAVDAAYAAFPSTTEQINDPDAYKNGETAITVDLLDTPITGYEVGEEATWGEQAYEALFAQSLTSRTAAAAADGWGGDTYRLLWDGENVVFMNLFVGDTADDAQEMFDAWTEFKDSQIPSDRAVFVGAAGNEVLVIVADDESALDAALEPYRSTFAD